LRYRIYPPVVEDLAVGVVYTLFKEYERNKGIAE
jgi:hypothetical protein